MITTILFLIVLSVLVFVHELGHFLASKMFNIRVDEFALGFPPKVFSVTKGETTYSLNALPLGGYVKIHGENPEEALDPTDKRNFQNASWWKQVIVLAAGVTFNIVFAWLLLSLALMVGTSKAAVDGLPAEYIHGDGQVLIQEILPESPAAAAGIKSGDIVFSVNGTEVTTAEGVQNAIKSAAMAQATGSIDVVVRRNQGLLTYGIVPSSDKVIGIALAETAEVRMPPLAALKYGAVGTYSLTTQLGQGVLGFFGQLFVGQASFDQVSGPVGIAKVVGVAGREGFSAILFVGALISISLAIMNVLPFPALDGGRIVIAVVEGATRRRLNTKFVNAINTGGFILLLLLMLVVTVKDIL